MRIKETYEGKCFYSAHLQDNWSTSGMLKSQVHYLLSIEQNKTDLRLSTRETQKYKLYFNNRKKNHILKLKGTSEVSWSSLFITSEYKDNIGFT